MKQWPIKTAIAATILASAQWGAQALDIAPTFDEAEPIAEQQIQYQMAGLRFDRSNIVTAFHGHLTKYFGDCPGKDWSGSATKGNVRFIAYNQAPAKKLRVELVNLTTGERLRKRYTKEGRGSFDFEVLDLGVVDGPQEIQYKIYNKKTDTVLSTGNFSYELTTSSSSEFRQGEWRWEEFCASDYSDSLDKCDVLGQRERMYCAGSRTEHIRAEYLSPPRHRHHKHHKHSPKKHHVRKSKRW